jgi:hypothetical protein
MSSQDMRKLMEAISINESKDSKTFDVEKDGKKIGIVWKNSDGNWEGELSKTGMSWEFLTAKTKADAVKSLMSELGESKKIVKKTK